MSQKIEPGRAPARIPAGPEAHLFNLGGKADHGEHDVAGSGDLPRGRSPLGARGQQVCGLFAGPRGEHNGMPCLQQVPAHRPSHHPGPDPSHPHVRHGSASLPLL